MRHNIELSYENIKLTSIRLEDIDKLRSWRNNAELTPYLSKIDYITKDMQLAWYNKDLENQDCYSFAIYETQELQSVIGSVALYNFNGNTAEFGRLLIGDIKARGKGYGYLATILCLQIGFNQFNLDEIIAYVFEENIAAVKAYKKAGFKILGKDDKDELKISITKEDFIKYGGELCLQ